MEVVPAAALAAAVVAGVAAAPSNDVDDGCLAELEAEDVRECRPCIVLDLVWLVVLRLLL